MKRKRIYLLLVLVGVTFGPILWAAWDKGQPIEGGLAPDLNDVIRANNRALETALDAWIRFETGGTQTGQPRQGSARVYFQDSAPTARLDGEYFASTDLGCIWVDSNATIDNQLNILTSADGAGTETWTPISTEIIAVLLASARVFTSTLGVTGNFAVNTDKFTVAAATGNTAVAGTLDIGGSIAVDETLDEDDMASDSATALSTQQAIKKYADDHVGDTSGEYYVYRNVNGTPTKVYTKYLTGTLDSDASTSIAHGVSSGLTKILNVGIVLYDGTTGNRYGVKESHRAVLSAYEYEVWFNATNITVQNVAARWQGQTYKIKIDYML